MSRVRLGSASDSADVDRLWAIWATLHARAALLSVALDHVEDERGDLFVLSRRNLRAIRCRTLDQVSTWLSWFERKEGA